MIATKQRFCLELIRILNKQELEDALKSDINNALNRYCTDLGDLTFPHKYPKDQDTLFFSSLVFPHKKSWVLPFCCSFPVWTHGNANSKEKEPSYYSMDLSAVNLSKIPKVVLTYNEQKGRKRAHIPLQIYSWFA